MVKVLFFGDRMANTVKFSCENRQHKEANKCPDHPCWCWLSHHTYEFSQEIIPLTLAVWLQAGPREKDTRKIQIQLSRDGKSYETIETLTVPCKTKLYHFVRPDKLWNKRMKFLRFYSPDGWVDYSKGTLGYMIPCTEGETKCVGYDLYKCIGGKWQLVERNSEQCGYVPPECIEGATKCVGYDLYKCIGGKWQLVERNSEQCGYQPPSPPPAPGIPEIPPWAVLVAAGVGLIGMYLIFGGKS